MSDIGGRELGAGIAAAGRSLGDGIAKYRERRKLDKEDDAAFGAVGTAVEHMVKQGSLPEGVLTKYMDISQGGIEQKRGFLRGLGTVLQYVDRATERKAQADRAAADDLRADRYLELQVKAAKEREAYNARMGLFRGELAEYAQPTTTTVGAGSYAVPVPVQRRFSPEFIVGRAAKHNVDPPAELRHFLSEPPEPAWEPRAFDVDGTKMVTTSRNSAMPVNRSSPASIEVQPWMTGEDRDAFIQNIQDLPIKQAKEAFAIRRQARPEEFKSGDAMMQMLAAMMGGANPKSPPAPRTDPSTPALKIHSRYTGWGERKD